MREQMDIVVGDFGRPGTLRYLEAFSERERELIAARLAPGRSIFDEHRRVQLTVLCQLRHIKQRILAPYFLSGQPLDEGVMVGTLSGKAVEEIVPELAALLAEHVRLAHEQGARRIRIVFPCNTLGLLAEPLGQALKQRLTPVGPLVLSEPRKRTAPRDSRSRRGDDSTEVAIVPMQPLVAEVLRERGLRSVRILGTPACMRAYRQVLQETDPAVEVLDNSIKLVRAYEKCIECAIRGNPPEDEALGVVISCLSDRHKEPTAVVEACTDVSLGIGLDALEIYADRLVHEAYDENTNSG